MTRLSSTFAGLTFKNPLMVGSCSLTADAESIETLVRAGAGSIVTKTISPETRAGQSGFKAGRYATGWTCKADPRVSLPQAEALLKRLRQSTDVPLIVNVIGRSDNAQVWGETCQRLEAAGLEAEQIDLAELCESLLAKFLDAASARHIDLGLEVTPAQTRGHTWLLRELLINLVDNAIKYTPARGHVTLRCGQHETPEGRRAWIEVEDDGPGIAPAERERVLQRFYRVPGSPAGGHGLGLAIADGIARAHRTQLQFDEGAQERGLRVRVVFDAVAH